MQEGEVIEYLMRARSWVKKELDAPYHHFTPDNKQNSTNRIHFKYFIGFIQQFLNHSSIQSSRSKGVSGQETFLRQKRARNKEVELGKKWIAYGKVIFLKGMAGVYN